MMTGKRRDVVEVQEDLRTPKVTQGIGEDLAVVVGIEKFLLSLTKNGRRRDLQEQGTLEAGSGLRKTNMSIEHTERTRNDD